MAVGSVKGSVLESVVADVVRLLEEGRLSRAELNRRLPRDDVAFLDSTIMPSLWYPLDAYARLVDVLVREDGGDAVDYLVRRGRRTAERLYKAGLYRQLDATLEHWGETFGALMETLGVAMFHGTHWTVTHVGEGAKDGSFHIEVMVPENFPECARWSSQGFIEYLGGRAQGGEAAVRCTSTRPEPTLLVFDTISI
jgi:hypothetical protein